MLKYQVPILFYIATLYDIDGCFDSDTFFVSIINDTILPEAKAKDILVYLDEEGKAEITPEQINNGSTDYCGVDSIFLDLNEFCRDDIGLNDVILEVYDEAGNVGFAYSQVSIVDTFCSAYELSIIGESLVNCHLDDSIKLNWISENGPFIVEQKIGDGEWAEIETTNNVDCWIKTDPNGKEELTSYYYRILDLNGCTSNIDSIIVHCKPTCSEDKIDLEFGLVEYYCRLT